MFQHFSFEIDCKFVIKHAWYNTDNMATPNRN